MRVQEKSFSFNVSRVTQVFLILLPIAGSFLLWHFAIAKDYSYFANLVFVLPLLITQIFREQKIKSLVGRFFVAAEKFQNNISGTNAQFYESCTQLEASNEDQSSAVIETSATGDEISAMITRSTESISCVNDSISEINDLIKASEYSSEKLGENLSLSLENNQLIMKALTNVSDTLKELTCTFEDVSQKTQIINDIVFQTKLLSFNASVEAARAGEHGRGFTIVAQEIGNLARTSGESASSINKALDEANKKIDSIISSISTENKNLSERLETMAHENLEKLNEFKANFDKTTNKTNLLTQRVGEVTSAAAEQSKGVNELRDAIYMINGSVQKNTLVVSQTVSLANTLNSYISDFRSIFNQNKTVLKFDTAVQLDQIKWDDKYLIGVNEMDEEHIVLLDKINILIKEMNEENSTRMSKAFSDLKEYTVFHFTEEEEFLQKIEYPSYESHKKVHENLLAAVERYETDLRKGALDRIKLASFLKNWLFTHIMGVDIKYAEHYKSHQYNGHKNAA